MTTIALNKMVEDGKISGVYALDTCWVQIYPNGNEDYLKYGANSWGTAGWSLSKKDKYMYECGLGIDELDVEMTKKMNGL